MKAIEASQKTDSPIRQKNFCENRKVDIKKYIQVCLQCQLTKLFRDKTKIPMVITDTRTTAFEKISMDIVGPLSETKSGNLYILTIQDNSTKLPSLYDRKCFREKIYLHIWIVERSTY